MILCLNLNAAIDKTIVVPLFELNRIHRSESVILLPGGKGCNAARALKTLGESPVVSGWIGGFAGQFIETGLHQEGIQTDFVHTDFESRTCTSILDRERQTLTEIYETGEPIPPEKVEELRSRIQATIRGYQAVTLSGSLPPGVPSDFYASVIKAAQDAGVLTFLDTSGEALCQGLEAGPFLVKPNETETRTLLGLGPDEAIDFPQAASEISKKYKTNVLLSLGAQGAIVARGPELFVVENPIVEAKSAVGSGDCTVAGITHGILRGFSFEESVIRGIAAGTANTLMMGAGQFEMHDFERLCGQVRVVRK
jgi:tagatose 6-phosphate kinase